jgi:hypothetical protein
MVVLWSLKRSQEREKCIQGLSAINLSLSSSLIFLPLTVCEKSLLECEWMAPSNFHFLGVAEKTSISSVSTGNDFSLWSWPTLLAKSLQW